MYSDYEMSKYSEFMEYVEKEVNKSNIPNNHKLRMMEKRNLHKKNSGTIWFLEENGYEVEFMPFRQWLLQEDRNRKIEELLK